MQDYLEIKPKNFITQTLKLKYLTKNRNTLQKNLQKEGNIQKKADASNNEQSSPLIIRASSIQF